MEKNKNYKLELLTTAFNFEQLNDFQEDLDQVAIVGRSNVGKSSIINALANNKKLAKVSSTPGKTRSVNFYKIAGSDFSSFLLVDLPGYGFASVSKSEKESWSKLIQDYIENNPKLLAMILLLDSRLSPQKNDLEMLNYARNINMQVIPVFTKTDKCTQKEVQKKINEWQVFLDNENIIVSSAKTNRGTDKIIDAILNLRGDKC